MNKIFVNPADVMNEMIANGMLNPVDLANYQVTPGRTEPPMAPTGMMLPMPTPIQNVPEMLSQAPAIEPMMQMPQTNAMMQAPEPSFMDRINAMAQQQVEQSGGGLGLLQQGIAGLEDNYLREILPADLYLKKKQQEDEANIARQGQILRSLQLESDLDYRRQQLDLERERNQIARETALRGGDAPASVREYQFYSDLPPEEQARYLGVKRAQQILDTGAGYTAVGPDLGLTPLIDKKLSPEALPETRQAQAAASEVGKELGAAQAKLGAMEAAMPGFVEVTDKLSKLGKIASYTTAQQVRDASLREFGVELPDSAVAKTEYMATVDNEVLPMLRDTFGAAFTVAEGDRLRATLGNEKMSPAEKDAALKSFIDAKTREVRKLQRQTGAPVTPQTQKPVTEMTDEELKAFIGQ